MSRKTHEISTSSLVFNNITAVGIWVGERMLDPANREETDTMLKEIQVRYSNISMSLVP